MEFTITTGIKQLKTLINETADLTVVYRGIQRNYVWSNPSKKGYNNSLLKGRAVGTFVLADIQSCYDKARMDGNVSDMEFFDGFLKRNFEYISIDGNNRTQFILSEYKEHLKNYRDTSVEVRKVLNHEIAMNVVKYATKMDLHQMAIDINANTSWNKQETRNAILGMVSDFIRTISDKMESVSLKIKKINVKRLADDEMYATFLYYSQHKCNTITSTNLSTMYKSNVGLLNLPLFESVLSNWGKMISYFVKSKMGSIKSVSHNLFYFLWEMKRTYNYKLNEDMIEPFITKYVELENERMKNSIDGNSGINLWYQLNRSVSKNIDKKVKRIMDDFGGDIGLYFYELDTVRNFKVEDKLSKCIETDGIMVKLDGSIEVVTPLQSMDGNLCEGDHTKPHTKGGKTNSSNLGLLPKSDNRKKGKKILKPA
jgi:hypothetical protein